MTGRDPLRDPAPLIRRVYSYVAYRIGEGAEAEDVTGAVFERALRYRASYDASKGDVTAWLIGIARRCIADRHFTIHEQVDELELASEEDVAQETMRRLDLRAALALLSAEDQELLSMRYGADLTAKQIAEVLDAKTNAVEVRLHRALARLRAVLDPAAAPDRAASSASPAEAHP